METMGICTILLASLQIRGLFCYKLLQGIERGLCWSPGICLKLRSSSTEGPFFSGPPQKQTTAPLQGTHSSGTTYLEGSRGFEVGKSGRPRFAALGLLLQHLVSNPKPIKP